jgi:hypothetical protein
VTNVRLTGPGVVDLRLNLEGRPSPGSIPLKRLAQNQTLTFDAAGTQRHVVTLTAAGRRKLAARELSATVRLSAEADPAAGTDVHAVLRIPLD